MSATNIDRTDRPSPGSRLVAVLSVFLLFMVSSAVRTPVPAVNEPHYLAKAKHYWNPDFCRGDFFLESADAHAVFFQTVGLLTQWLTLEQTAWVARGIALLLLSIGWCSLMFQLLRGTAAVFWSAGFFLILTALGQASRLLAVDENSLRVFDLAGEWIIGGVEGKVFAYAFAFWAMGLWLGGGRRRAAVCAGLAISFHPVVGVWSLAAGCFAIAVDALMGTRHKTANSKPGNGIAAAAVQITLLLVAALPGLVPAIQMVLAGDPEADKAAAFVQVNYRLKHHLDPMDFPWTAYASYAAMVVFWFAVRRRANLHSGEQWFTSFVVASLLICLCGVLLGWRNGELAKMPYWAFRVTLLKFYWFRLADVMVLVATAVALAGLMQSRLMTKSQSSGESLASSRSTWIPTFAVVALFAGSLFLPSPDRAPSLTAQQLNDWKDACRWISAETPADALFVTPTFNWAFKWHARRAEFVNYKDVPQDAAGILEWNDRLRSISQWSKRWRKGVSIYPAGAVEDLSKRVKERQPAGEYYIVAVDEVFGPFEAKPVYENETCRVYRLP